MKTVKDLVESLMGGKLEAIVPLLDYLYENSDPRWCSVNQAFGHLHWSLNFPSFGMFLKEVFWMELVGTDQEVFDETWRMIKNHTFPQGTLPYPPMGQPLTEEQARRMRELMEGGWK